MRIKKGYKLLVYVTWSASAIFALGSLGWLLRGHLFEAAVLAINSAAQVIPTWICRRDWMEASE